MCGLAGLLSPDGRSNCMDVVRRMTDSIAHRGPDDEGFWSGTAKNGVRIGLGHRRLSIIDLGTGHQPLGNEDGSVQIVFNGEIYNYRELRDDLIKRGHRFATASDTEVIVHAYEEFGRRCVERLRGMFAFAIWDGNQDCLFLARDRFGKKPLFLWEKNGVLLFASEIKALLASSLVEPRVDEGAVWQYLSYRYVPGNATLLRGVLKLPPGTTAIWRNGTLDIEPYYFPPDMRPLTDPMRSKDAVADFLRQLDDAVACRMVSDVPFGAFLSGGIDSSAVVALMSRHSDMPVKTFSVGFTESAYTELGYARTIAEQFATDHHELTVSQDHLIDHLPELIRFRDAPVSEPSDIPIYLLSKEAAKTVKMVLTGEGSDEFLGGYPKHVYERYVELYQRLPGILRRGIIEPLVQALPYKFHRAKTAILNMGLEDRSERMARWFGALPQRERARLAAFSQPPSSYVPYWEQLPQSERSSLRSILSFDQTSWLPDNLLERGDRMTMAASIEARMPFMDHLLVDYVASLPDEYRVRGRTTKWLLREAMKSLLPGSILERPKVGFRVPVNEWFRGSMRDYLCDHLTGNDSRTLELYNRGALQRILDEHIKGRQNHEKLLWSLLNLELWYRQTFCRAS